MDSDQRELLDQATAFLGLEVWHYQNNYIIMGHEFALGECAADILNFNFDVLDRAIAPMKAIAQSTKNKTRIDFEFVEKVQQIVNDVVAALFKMRPYCALPFDHTQLYEMFTGFYRQRILTKRFNDDDKEIFKVLSQRLFTLRADLLRIQMLYIDLLDNYVYKNTVSPDSRAVAAAYERQLDDIYDERKPKKYFDKSGQEYLGRTILNFSVPVVIDFGIPPPGSPAPGICEIINIISLFDFVRWEISHSMIAGNLIKRCKCCGKFFALEPGYAYEYCANIAPGETMRTCRDVGALKSHEEKIKNDPVWAPYRRAYKKYNARVRNKTMSQQAFLIWADNAKILRDETHEKYMEAKSLQKEFPLDSYTAKLNEE